MFKKEDLSQAVTIWIGSSHGFPEQYDDKVIQFFGDKKGKEILSYLKELKGEFYKSQAWLQADTWSEISQIARNDFLNKYPSIPEEVFKAFEWCYSYSYK